LPKKTDRKSDISILDRNDRKVQKPKKYKVVMHNDDYTPMDFVILILQTVFLKDFPTSKRLMLDVHKKGRGIAGIYSKEIADTKCMRSIEIAKTAGYPFLVTAEPE